MPTSSGQFDSVSDFAKFEEGAFEQQLVCILPSSPTPRLDQQANDEDDGENDRTTTIIVEVKGDDEDGDGQLEVEEENKATNQKENGGCEGEQFKEEDEEKSEAIFSDNGNGESIDGTTTAIGKLIF